MHNDLKFIKEYDELIKDFNIFKNFFISNLSVKI